MDHATVFDVDVHDLERLNAEQAVDVLRELLWAEAGAVGIAKNLINVPTSINVADGGIDAEVHHAQPVGGQGIIKLGITRYQVKTGKFSLKGGASIRAILLRKAARTKKNPTPKDLQPRVKACFDKGGTLVVVLFGSDNPDKEEDAILNEFRKLLKKVSPAYGTAQIEVWRQNHIIGFLKPFPSIARFVNSRGIGSGLSRSEWAKLGNNSARYEAGLPQKKTIDDLRSALRNADGAAIHIRLLGEAGVGKTRLAFEATAAPDLAPLVLYFSRATDFLSSPLSSELVREDNTFWLILVVDECSTNDWYQIWNRLHRQGDRIRLFTIYNERDEADRTLSCFEAPLLEDSQISAIIEGYNVPADTAKRWAVYCGGSPRVAHVIAQNLVNNPEDILRPSALENIWKRYVAGYRDPDDPQVKLRSRVLQYLSLFKRFGFEKFVKGEAEEICNIIGRLDGTFSLDRFKEIVIELRNQKILQGDATLYITPKLLHIWLWSEWWKTYGHTLNAAEFYESLSKPLRSSFADMLIYAGISDAAKDVVRDLLGPGGPFHKAEFLNSEEGGRFFLKLAEADPKAALWCLDDTIGAWNGDELLKFTRGRRGVIHALEKIAVWRELFPSAARLLLSLGESENETWTNNASGVFAYLFSNFVGRVAPTEAPPEERLPVIEEALHSSSEKRRRLALKAIDSALRVSGVAHQKELQYQGLLRRAELWTPKDRKEHVEAYRRVWCLLRDTLPTLSEKDRAYAGNLLFARATELLWVDELSGLVLETVEESSRRGLLDQTALLGWLSRLLEFRNKNVPPPIYSRLEAIRSAILGTGFPAHLRLYVGRSSFSTNPKDDALVQREIERLAAQAVEDTSQLRDNLSWLVTSAAGNGFAFGFALGKHDAGFSLLNVLLEAQRSAVENPSGFFLGGYLRAVSEADPALLDDTLDSVAKDRKLTPFLVELTWRTRVTDRSVKRLISSARNGLIEISDLRTLAFGRAINNLSEVVFNQLARYLFSVKRSDAAAVLLDLYAFYYLHGPEKKPLPESSTLALLSQPALFRETKHPASNSMLSFHWGEIATAFIKQFPERGIKVAQLILKHFRDFGSPLNAYSREVTQVLDLIVDRNPDDVWNLVAEKLANQADESYYVSQWLRGTLVGAEGEGALAKISSSAFWKWIDAEPTKRASFFATFVPKRLFRHEGEECLARELLVRYGRQRTVRSSLAANFMTGGWAGPASVHFIQAREQLLAFRSEEQNENVKRFIDELVSSYDAQIERAQVEEERQRF